jgi:hypothetical protein
VPELLAFVHEQHSLVGQSEVCAGPLPLIERAAAAMIELDATRQPLRERKRRDVAWTLVSQVRLGIAWQTFDLAVEREVFAIKDRLRPRNDFVAGTFRRRFEEVQQDRSFPRATLRPVLPSDVDGLERIQRALVRADRDYEQHASGVVELLQMAEGGLLPDADLRPQLALRLLHYVLVYRRFLERQWALEKQLRRKFGYSEEVPMKAHSTILSPPKALDWFETILGHRLQVGCQPGFDLLLGNHKRKLPLVA